MQTAVSPTSIQKTILVVDDDAGVLRFVNAVLIKGNYIVLTDTNGTNALRQSRQYEHEIHLLLSDFQMPGMTGAELANQMMLDRPDLTVLLMSGFTGENLNLHSSWHFLPKPFLSSQLRTVVAGLV